MVLVADVGNTNIKLGIFENEKLIDTVVTTHLLMNGPKTPDMFLRDILCFLHKNEMGAGDIEAVAISTVVPRSAKAFLQGVRKLVAIEPLVVDYKARTGIRIKTDKPDELGADRLVNAAAAFHDYGGSLLIIDFGTATTYDVVTENGEFLGGVIAPGLKICAEALWKKTAKLPQVKIEKPAGIMGTDTAASMQSGIFYGYLGQIEYFVQHLKEELKTDFKVIATGGLSVVFQGSTTVIDVFDASLTLRGLNYISKLNQFITSTAGKF